MEHTIERDLYNNTVEIQSGLHIYDLVPSICVPFVHSVATAVSFHQNLV